MVPKALMIFRWQEGLQNKFFVMLENTYIFNIIILNEAK